MTCAQGLLRLLCGGARSWSATGLDGVVVGVSTSQSVDLGLSPSQVISKDFEKWYSQLSCLALSTKG